MVNEDVTMTLEFKDGTERTYEFEGGSSAGGGQGRPWLDSADSQIAVETEDATSVGETTATLNGELLSLGEFDEVSVFFEYRQDGQSTWQEAEKQTLSEEGSFDESIDGLESDTVYEFRAAGESNSESTTGETRTFATESDGEIQMRIDDLTAVRANDPAFYVSYDVSVSHDEVEVVAESTESFAEDSTVSPQARSGVLLEPGYGGGEQFEISVRAFEGQTVVAERTISTTADTVNPAENDDLSQETSAELEEQDIRDMTQVNQNNVRYRFDYEVTTSGSFSSVELLALNRNGDGASVTQTETDRSVNNERLEPGDGAETTYKVGILVRDDDGAVVDDIILEDIANNEDPS